MISGSERNRTTEAVLIDSGVRNRLSLLRSCQGEENNKRSRPRVRNGIPRVQEEARVSWPGVKWPGSTASLRMQFPWIQITPGSSMYLRRGKRKGSVPGECKRHPVTSTTPLRYSQDWAALVSRPGRGSNSRQSTLAPRGLGSLNGSCAAGPQTSTFHVG